MINTTPYQNLIDRAVAAYAASRYQTMDWNNVNVCMSSRLRVAGGRCICRRDGANVDITVEFSTSIFAGLTDEQKFTIVSHELAHAVAFKLRIASHHDERWRRIDLAMGGTGSRTHSFAAVNNVVTRGIVVDTKTDKHIVVKPKLYRAIACRRDFRYVQAGTISCDPNTKTYRWTSSTGIVKRDAPLLRSEWKLA